MTSLPVAPIGAERHWPDAGAGAFRAGENTLAFRDLTGFNGCRDAIFLSSIPAFALVKRRRRRH
ncbi:MAG: hypothetical protein LBC18_04005 [Opitutaceae bacterium]|nr:hypothetical protein [Opitutaceae bacterium]